MNHCVPDWSVEDGSGSFHGLLPSANHRRSTWPENELVELLWQNGHVVLHSQTHRKTVVPPNETRQCQKPESILKSGEPLKNSANMVQEEMASWLPYSTDDPFDKEFCSDFFYGIPTTESATIDKLEDVVAGDKFTKERTLEENSIPVLEQSNILQLGENMMPPQSEVVASFPQTRSADGGGDKNFAHFSGQLKSDSGPLNDHFAEKRLGNQIEGEAGGSSLMMTKELSICGSNQVQKQFDVSCSNTVKVASAKGVNVDAQTRFSHERTHNETHETTITSSSGGSGCTIGRTSHQSASTRILKRKGRDADDSEYQSEEAGYESMETNRQAQRSASARRKRAAEVHNLSERRRRDRINEKMRALQGLIPHCNKSDKASLLDDAIEYLKSLQLQVQIMWMGSGMASMMFPSVHHYMSQMGVGMGHGAMPSIHGPVPFLRFPLIKQSVSSNPAVNQASSSSSPGIIPINFQNQMQNPLIPCSYAPYLGFHHIQPSPQMMNLYAYGSQLMAQNQMTHGAGGCEPCGGGAPCANIKTGNAG